MGCHLQNGSSGFHHIPWEATLEALHIHMATWTGRPQELQWSSNREHRLFWRDAEITFFYWRSEIQSFSGQWKGSHGSMTSASEETSGLNALTHKAMLIHECDGLAHIFRSRSTLLTHTSTPDLVRTKSTSNLVLIYLFSVKNQVYNFWAL